MKPIDRFRRKPKSFWASVRSFSQHLGYSKGDQIKVPTAAQMMQACRDLGLNTESILLKGKSTPLAVELIAYFDARAKALVEIVEPNLMNADEAKALYASMKIKLKPKLLAPMNKQKGEKKAEAFLTALVNMQIEAHAEGMDFNHDPRELTTITRDGEPLRTLARRVDGAFPSTIIPVAVWEIKEYYYTTTFGSRVADGVYETLLDGMELEELREHEGIDVKHYLMVDAYFTWWNCGKAYLCRMFDMLHMGYVDEILFGREVVTEMPRIVAEWVTLTKERGASGLPEDRSAPDAGV